MDKMNAENGVNFTISEMALLEAIHGLRNLESYLSESSEISVDKILFRLECIEGVLENVMNPETKTSQSNVITFPLHKLS